MTVTAEALAFAPSPFSFGYLMQVVFSLAIVLACIYATGKYLLPRLKTTPSGRLIKVLDRVYLEPQVTAYILKVGQSAWLIISGNKQVTRVEKLAESDLV